MPHPQSPYRPSSADLSGGLDSAQLSKDELCAPLPLHPQGPLRSSSPFLSSEVSHMATALQPSTPSRAHQSSSTMMGLYTPGTMQWTAPSSFPLNHVGQDSADYHVPAQSTTGPGDFYHYARHDVPYNDNYNLTYPAHYSGSGCPQLHSDLEITGLHNGLPNDMSPSYPPAAYQIEPQTSHDAMDLADHEINGQLMQLSDDYDYRNYGSHIKAEEHSDYQSPYSDITRDSTPHDDLPGYPNDQNAAEAGGIDKEQPYAQLIYQALLGAPDNTMILRDIYDWFKKYTDKASGSETKGWQNSIRHNLSMNGAFEKVDQPCEDSRKGFMWRLTQEALREGVKSTTRYRSKQPNKRGGHHTQLPQPQRQASGAKGGQAARRSARIRRATRVEAYRSDPYTSRSVPASFDSTFNSGEASMPFSPSPYNGSEIDHTYDSKTVDFGNSLVGPRLDLFSSVRSFGGSPIPHSVPSLDTSYMPEHSPTESLFTDSPSPPMNEPRTPVSQGGWGEQDCLAAPSVFDGLEYQDYAG